MIRNHVSERLYLSKADQSIYIDNCKIPQHHIDGIRFLYKQYKKKKPGVIITTTLGYSRKVQIVLFLKAVRHLFDKPVLVLCLEGGEHDWMEQFQTWTDLCDGMCPDSNQDIVLELQKPFVKKRVLINTMSNLPAFCRRDWGVVVMDGEKTAHQVLGLPFKADYKIWITSVNMKENIGKFSQIYKWINPKEKFDESAFTPDERNVTDVVEKAILLDHFMEDIVAGVEEPQSSREIENDIDYPLRRVSRKNKDATGLKIKRTRRRIYDDDDDVPLSKTKKDVYDAARQLNDSKTTALPNNTFEIALSTNDNIETADDSSMDNFKRKSIEEFNEDLLGEEESSPGDKVDTANNQTQVNWYLEPDSSTDVNSDRYYEMDTQVFGIDDACDDQSAKLNEPVKHLKLDITRNTTSICHEIKADMNDYESFVESDSISDVIKPISNDKKRSKEPPSLYDEQEPDVLETSRKSPLSCDETKTEYNNTESRDSPSSCDKINADVKVNETSPESPKSEVNEINSQTENTQKHQKCSVNTDTPNNDENNVNSNEVETKSNQNEVEENECVTNEKVEPVTNSLKRNNIDDKIKEMEQKALKKFKGSILDRLF